MKKFLVLFFAVFIGTSVFAHDSYDDLESFESNLHAIRVEKAMTIGSKIINTNNLKRVPIQVNRSPKIVNAYSIPYYKTITISSGMFPYFDNDDELAYILAHEIAHSIEGYDGFIKLISMSANSKKYECKADLNGIDYMVKAGYNPIAGIIFANKIFSEPLWDWGFLSSHPKGSKRMLEMYKYIYVKYPQYLNSPMTKNIIFQNFLNSQADEIKKFEQKQKRRQMNQEVI